MTQPESNPLLSEAAFDQLQELAEREPEAALGVARERLALASSVSNIEAQLAARYCVALALLRLGRHAECRSQINVLLASDAIEHAQWFARAHHLQAKVADQVGDYDTALEELQAARSLFELLRDDLGIGNCLLSIGVNFARSEDHQESLAFYRRAYDVFKAVGDQAATGAALNNIGIACKHTQRYAEAEQALREATTIFEGLGQSIRLGHCWANLASLRAHQGQLAEADRLYRIAIEKLQIDEVEHYRAEVLREHGELMLKMQQPEMAIKTLNQALSLAERYQEPRVEYRAHHALAKGHAELDDFKQAYRHESLAAELEVKALKSQYDAKVLNLQAMQRAARLLAEKEALAEEYRDLAQRAAVLDREARRDSLTKTYNRRHLEHALSQYQANDTMFSLAVIDIDNFKGVNDHYSHGTGDEVLMAVAELLKQHTRPQDLVARYGGDEFVLMLDRADEALAAAICGRVWAAVVEHPWTKLGKDLSVTISIGLADRRAQELPAQTLARADAGLYAAKRAGKNRINHGGPLPA